MEKIMAIGFLNPAMLAGLAALLIPPLIHLLHRRRYDVVDWGAMQFLQVSQTTRRRLLLEELLLMALRMGLIALLVLALAAPYATSPWMSHIPSRPSRDVVLLLDNSSSMTLTDGVHPSPFETARTWALAYLKDMRPGDRAALLLARQPPLVLCDFSGDLDFIRDKLAELQPPRGNPDWPRSLETALKLLRDTGKNPQGDLVLLTDLQKFGWVDPATLSRWEKVRGLLRSEKDEIGGDDQAKPRIWLVEGAAGLPSGLPNFALAPLKTTRALAWVGQQLKFSSALRLEGVKDNAPPYRLRLEVDGKFVEVLPPPATIQGARPGRQVGKLSYGGQHPFPFKHRFHTPGSHLVSVIVEPDMPQDKRPDGYQLRDALPADNRQDLAVEVVRVLPVLLVDGADKLSPESATFFLEKALAGRSDSKQPALVMAQAIPYQELAPEMFQGDKQHPRPRVVVFADVPRLTPAPAAALEQYLADGGGVWVLLGPRMAKEKNHYNDSFYRNGSGWLPARIDNLEGDPAHPDFAPGPDVMRFQHAALEFFRDEPTGSLVQARFPRWWKVATEAPGRGVPVALLTSADPFLVEQPFKAGRVLLSPVPMDRSWGGNFPSLGEFPIFVHELVYYLADVRSHDVNVQPGQPVRLPGTMFGGADASLPDRLVLTKPQGSSLSPRVESWPWLWEDTGAVGAYRVQAPDGKIANFVVQGDPRESDLTPCNDEDRARLARLLGLQYVTDSFPEEQDGGDQRQDIWWLLMAGVILLLCGEVWWTRRMVKGRGAG